VRGLIIEPDIVTDQFRHQYEAVCDYQEHLDGLLAVVTDEPNNIDSAVSNSILLQRWNINPPVCILLQLVHEGLVQTSSLDTFKLIEAFFSCILPIATLISSLAVIFTHLSV